MSNERSNERRRRYPGPHPFTYTDRAIFCGRTEAVQKVAEMIDQYNHLLLYARSGAGKSSLINAGLMPLVDDSGKYNCLKVIFGAYNKREPLMPLDSAILALKRDSSELMYLDKLLFHENSLWYTLKKVQLALIRDAQDGKSIRPQSILMIFDQFEELFTYPPKDVAEFKQALAEALFIQIPDRFRDELKKNALSDEEMELLHSSLNLKIVFSIRSDRMALLNRLTDFIPDILKNFYEIRPLTRAQTKKAIVDPSQMDGYFISNQFHYQNDLVESLLDYLEKDQEQYIESYQVQIICKYIEDLLVDGKIEGEVTQSNVISFEDIFSNFYESVIAKVPDKTWYDREKKPVPSTEHILKIREATRTLLEKGLIFRTGDETGIRLNLYTEQITKEHSLIDGGVLQALVNERMVRDTPDAAGRMRYELSHDTLVKPILRALDIRDRQIRENADREQLEKLQREETQRRSKEIGISGVVDINFQYIVRCLKNRNVVLVVGENAFYDVSGVPFMDLFARTVAGLDAAYDEEEQLFTPNDRSQRWKISNAICDFFKSEVPSRLASIGNPLGAVLDLPFPTILTLEPSNIITDELRRKGVPFRRLTYSAYHQSEMYESIQRNGTIVCSLMGNVEDSRSLAISHQDVFQNMASLLQSKPPSEFESRLRKARAIIFLGVNFNRYANQVIFWQLFGINEEALRMSITPMPGHYHKELQIKALLNISFVDDHPLDFFAQLTSAWRDENSGNPVTPLSAIITSVKHNINTLIRNDEIDRALQVLLDVARVYNLEMTSDLVSLQSQLNRFQKRYAEGNISMTEAQTTRESIARTILEHVYYLQNLPDQ